MSIPWLDFGGTGPDLYFFHANGYPPPCYQALLSLLAQKHHVSAVVQRPLWSGSRPEEIVDWKPLTQDLLNFLDEHGLESVTCIGHSMGGIALLRAALLAPERFDAIILIDPVLFPPGAIFIWRIIHGLGLNTPFHPLVEASRNRRRQFDDLERLFQGYRRKSVFKYMDDEALRNYVKGITCLVEGGYQLCYSPEWESRIYDTSAWHDMDIWKGLKNLKPRTLVLRGAETDTFWAATGRLVQKKQPAIKVVSIDKSTHLLPLERPREVSEEILAFLKGQA
jgi:pimeloyl-ACP methyl ester carboxylesterase